jgi:hypothetical protein
MAEALRMAARGLVILSILVGLVAASLYEGPIPIVSEAVLEAKAWRVLANFVKEPDQITVQRAVTKDLSTSIVCFSAIHEAGLTGKKTTGVYAVDVPRESAFKVVDDWSYAQFCRDGTSPASSTPDGVAERLGEFGDVSVNLHGIRTPLWG